MSSNVQFDENQDLSYQNARRVPKKSFLIGMVMRLGIKTEKQATLVLAIVALLLLAGSFVFVTTREGDYRTEPPSNIIDDSHLPNEKR